MTNAVNKCNKLGRRIERSQEIDNPYIVGPPLPEGNKLFVRRDAAIERIEQLLLDRRCPPLLLFGQRRSGKTSLLLNLGRLLPSKVAPLYADLGLIEKTKEGTAAFLCNLAKILTRSTLARRQIILRSLSELSVEEWEPYPFTRFCEWLEAVEMALADGMTALLILDEFNPHGIEDSGVDAHALLNLLRHVIQHRPRFKLLLAGSLHPEELGRWATYLVNIQAVQINYLAEDGARQLSESPTKEFALHYDPAAVRRVLQLTRAHPGLIQLLCREIVTAKNKGPIASRLLATVEDVEAAVPDAMLYGNQFYFIDLERNQVDEIALGTLRFIACQGEAAVVSKEDLVRNCPADLERVLTLLQRRELIESEPTGFRFQVEMIRRWIVRGRNEQKSSVQEKYPEEKEERRKKGDEDCARRSLGEEEIM